ncbi:hypothetical protein C8R44DRAFT_743363 [Mycena epipterygia]|nr:hypothetical protein C8R44DRAFT_743363 [Mycena epipterygia]
MSASGTSTSSRSSMQGPRPSRQRAETLPTKYHMLSGSSAKLRRASSEFQPLAGPSVASDTTIPETIIPTERPPLISEASLNRHGTLLSPAATTLRRAAELRSLLGNANSRLRGAVISQPTGREPTSFEQAKPRARVEIDIALHSNVCVEGGTITGTIKLRIRPRLTKESAISISDAKLRFIGFESIEGDHHEFFQYSTALSAVAASLPRIYNSQPDEEGFFTPREGVHTLEFEMHLPINGCSRPKGPLYGQSGAAVRYIALVYVFLSSDSKVKDEFDKRSIAHFYRDCKIWPRLNPSVVLAPAEQYIRASTCKRLFMGGNGEVKLTAALHRSIFIAGTQVSVNVSVQNDTKKLIKSLTLSLYRSTVVFKRKLRPGSTTVDAADPDACQTTTTRKSVATSILEMAQGFPRGHASTVGWWAGIPSGERSNFSHLLLIPPDALTHTRERLIEVEYAIRVSLNTGSLTADVFVTLPIQVVNLLSLDPPPPVTLHPQGELSIGRRSRSNSVAQVPSPLSRSRDECAIGRESDRSDLDSDEGFQDESDTEEDPQHEVQLGNLSLREDAEDLVQHAIVSAQMGDAPNALRPDSMDQSLPQVAAEHLEQQPEEPDNRQASNYNKAELSTSRPSRPRGPSSFALRVQNKLQATARQPVVPDDLRLQVCKETTSTMLSEANQDRLDVPSRSLSIDSAAYQIASSSFLNNRYFDCVSQSCAESAPSAVNSRPAGSRLLPRLPSIVGLPFPDAAPNLAQAPHYIAPFDHRNADLDRSDVDCSKSKRPQIAPGVSASSVKDKIKELEERVRAAEGY